MPEYIRAAEPAWAVSPVRTPAWGPLSPQQMPPTLSRPPAAWSTVSAQVGWGSPASKPVAKSVVVATGVGVAVAGRGVLVAVAGCGVVVGVDVAACAVADGVLVGDAMADGVLVALGVVVGVLVAVGGTTVGVAVALGVEAPGVLVGPVPAAVRL